MKQVRAGWLSPRLNIGASKYYIRGSDTLRIYPSERYRFVIIEHVEFTLPVFGQALSNEVIGTVPTTALGSRCDGLAKYLVDDPKVLFIDNQDHTKDCRRECAVKVGPACGAFQITPP